MNLILYAKGKKDKKYGAIQSLERMIYAPNLMYAALIPEDKKDRLIEYINDLNKLDQSVSFQIRKAGTSKVIYQIAANEGAQEI